jgi:hypothetical protein
MSIIHATKIYYTRSDGVKVPCLVPAYRSEMETWNKIPENEIAECTLIFGIQGNYYGQLHAVSQYCFDNAPISYNQVKNYDSWRSIVSLKIGWVNHFVLSGEVIQTPKSWKKQEMNGQEEFMTKLYNPAMDWFCDLLKMTREDLIRASQSYSGKQYRRLN